MLTNFQTTVMNQQDDLIFHMEDPEPELPGLPNATAVLVLGIASIGGAFYFGLPGIIFGIPGLFLAKKNKALYNSAPGTYTASSYNSLRTGRICSVTGLCLGSFIFLMLLFNLIFHVTFFRTL